MTPSRYRFLLAFVAAFAVAPAVVAAETGRGTVDRLDVLDPAQSDAMPRIPWVVEWLPAAGEECVNAL